MIMAKVEKPPRLGAVKALWDAALSACSLYGAVHLVPFLIKETTEKGVFKEICSSSAQSANPILYFFMWSKFFELVDTTFIIVGKKKLIFLHWYSNIFEISFVSLT